MAAGDPMRAGGGLDRWFDHAGARLRWRDDGAGPALLMLHGWALDLDVFEPATAALCRSFRVLRIDRRGYGASTGRPSLEADVDDALALIEIAGLDRLAVLGMSQGARVAAALARAAPGRIGKVILDGAPALRGLADEEHEPELPLEDFRRLVRGSPGELAAALSNHPLLRLARPTPATIALLHAVLTRYPGADLLQGPSVPGRHAPVPGQARFEQPALVLSGELDSPARLRIARRLAAVLPRAHHVMLEGAGHLACLDDATAYAAAITAFLLATPETP